MPFPHNRSMRLARFYGNPDYALDAITSKTLSFVHVTKLNDPFDPYFFFETDFGERYDLILDYVSNRLPNEFSWFLENIPPELWTKIVSDIRTYLQAQRQSTFMLSFIEAENGRHPKDNLLMWAHYGVTVTVHSFRSTLCGLRLR